MSLPVASRTAVAIVRSGRFGAVVVSVLLPVVLDSNDLSPPCVAVVIPVVVPSYFVRRPVLARLAGQVYFPVSRASVHLALSLPVLAFVMTSLRSPSVVVIVVPVSIVLVMSSVGMQVVSGASASVLVVVSVVVVVVDVAGPVLVSPAVSSSACSPLLVVVLSAEVSVGRSIQFSSVIGLLPRERLP